MISVGQKEEGPRLPREAESGLGVVTKLICTPVKVNFCHWWDCPEMCLVRE